MQTRRTAPKLALTLALLSALSRHAAAESLDIPLTTGKARITAISPTVFRIHIGPTTDPITSIYLDPNLKPADVGTLVHINTHRRISTPAGTIDIDLPPLGSAPTWSLLDAKGTVLTPPAPLLAATSTSDNHTFRQLDIGWPKSRKFEVYGSGNGTDALVQTAVVSRVHNGVAVVPYFWSPAGFATFAVGTEEDAPATCDGQDKGNAISWMVSGQAADLYVILAPTLIDSTREYLTLTGHPAVPPLWSFGYLQSRWGWKDKAYIDDTLAQFTARHIPLDAFIFDFEWYTPNPDYGVKPEGDPNYQDFSWNPKLFPDPAAQIKQFHDAGVHFVGIRKPRLGNADALVFARGKNWGFKGEGHDGFDARGLRFADPAARAWYADKTYPLLKTGVDGWWNDEGEFTYTNYSYWNQAEQTALSMQDNHARLWTLNRAFQPGTSRYGAAAWSGDIHATWKDLQSTPTTLLNWSLAGMPTCGCDIGGFSGEDTPELLTRWMQAGTFFPVMRAHSDISVKPHFPWLFGDAAEAAIKKTLTLRYQLIPTLYSLAHQTHTTGLPLMRPLALHYPTDPKTANLTTEWLVGDSLLAAPVLTQDNHKSIYLPQGTWYDFNTGEKYEGNQTLERDVPQDQTPLFVKAGTLLPLAAPHIEHTRDLTTSPLHLHIYPGQDATFTLTEDDGTTTHYTTGNTRQTTFTWTDATRTLSWKREGPYEGKNCFTTFQPFTLNIPTNAVQPLKTSGPITLP